jgi:TonB family protein
MSMPISSDPNARRPRYALVFIVIACMSPRVATQAPSDREAVLRMGLSPGSIAMLVEHVADPAVQRRLAEALVHASPDIRAAAARVAFVVGAKSLLPALNAVLARELQEDAAIEEIRAVASLGGPSYDPTIIEALARLGVAAPRAAAAFAFLRGEAALNALPAVRGADPSPSALVPFIVAARPDPPALARVAESAARAADWTLLEASIRTATQLQQDLPEPVLASGLGEAMDEGARLAAFRHLLRRWDGVRPLSDVLKTSLLKAADTRVEGDDDVGFVLGELMARAGGRQRTSSPRLMSLLEGPTWAQVRSEAARQLLTPAEVARADKSFGEATPRAPKAANPTPFVLHTVDRYPNRFLSDLIAVSGCKPRQARDQIAVAEVTLRPDGRAEHLTIQSAGLSDKACATAARVALVSHVTDWSTANGSQRVIVLPMAPEFVECRETMVADPRTPILASAAKMLRPKKTRDVRPVYPRSAIDDRVQGTVVLESVITRTGCVRDARVIASAEGRLDLASVRAVLGWRFSPARVGDDLVSVLMTLTVKFALE